MTARGFVEPITDAEVARLTEIARTCRGAVLTETSLAGSGHPGGSFSSMEFLLVLYHFARLRPSEPRWPERDRVVISNGHISPGVYTALASAGFFPLDELVPHFRQAGSPFEGHVERAVPGIEWSTGNLGQGLSTGVGFALGARLTGVGWHTFVAMSDAEQNKGQVAEARRVAAKYGLADLTVLVDLNDAQISGRAHDVMPVDVGADFAADGWAVRECDGHDIRAVYEAVAAAVADKSRPTAVLARTHIGWPVSFMTDDPQFHGRALKPDEYERAMGELGLTPELDRWLEARGRGLGAMPPQSLEPQHIEVAPGEPRTYASGEVTDNRSAWGAALLDLAEANPDLPLTVFDCDLAESVKTEAFAKAHPDRFIECGVGEHNAAAASGALSIVPGVPVFWADFGVFGIDEVYNQQRLNDINEAGLKLVVTHCGVDVGEDGKTHQCLDYVAAFRDFFGWKVVVPADPNQTDRAVRWAAGEPGRVCVAMGRSKVPVILDDAFSPAFAGDYEFRYGAIDWLREGTRAVVLTMGTAAGAAVGAVDSLAAEGIQLAAAVAASPLALEDAAMERACGFPVIVAIEDHAVRTGLGASVAAWMATHERSTRLVTLGVTDYQSSGAAADLMAIAGLDVTRIALALRAALGG